MNDLNPISWRTGHVQALSIAAALLMLAILPRDAQCDDPPPAPTGRTAAQADEPGFESLFDGKTLAGWDGDPTLWSVVDGAIRGATSDKTPLKENQFLIWKNPVANFTLRLEFRMADRGVGNSGVQYRSRRLPDVGRWVMGGYQADIDRTNRYVGILYEERGRGILAERGEKVALHPTPEAFRKEIVGSVGDAAEIVKGMQPGEWQSLEIIADGPHLIHKLNGRTAVDVVDHDAAHAANEGLVALQLHVGPEMQIEFKNIRLRKLPAAAKPAAR